MSVVQPSDLCDRRVSRGPMALGKWFIESKIIFCDIQYHHHYHLVRQILSDKPGKT